jgi:predicted metal-binding membrane protein
MAVIAAPSGRGLFLTASARRGLQTQAFRWAIAPSILAWLGLVSFTASGLEPALCLSPKTDAVHGLIGALGASLAGLNPAAVTTGGGLMLAAMMGPLLTPMITYVAARSFADRRDLSVGLFVAGYASVWTAAAAAAFVALLLLHAFALYAGVSVYAGLLGAAGAAAWQLSKAKRQALNRCHGVRPLRASGRAADVDAARFGVLHGWRCVRACAPTMFLTMGGAHGLTTMAVVFAVLLAERTAAKPRQAGAAALLLLTGVLSTRLALP